MCVLVCYEFPKNLYIKSTESNFEIFVQEFTLVAYDEENEILYYDRDTLSYPFTEYYKDIEKTNIEEVYSIEEYLSLRNDTLQSTPGLVTIAEIDSRENVRMLTESEPEKIIDVGGAKVKITRMYYE